MAEINYYADIDLNNGQVKNFKVDNSTSFPSIAGVGQLRYDTGNSVLKYHTGGGTWVTIGTSTGGVTTFTNTNGGTFVAYGTANSAASGAINIGDVDLTAGGTPSATTFLRGDNVWATPAGAYTSWTLAGDSGSSQAIADGNTATFAGGTGISTAASATDTLTITNSLPFNSITLAATSGSSSTISNNGTITIAAGSNISTTGNGSGTVTIAYTGGTGSMSSWTLSGDSGSSQSITDGNTVDIAGGTGVNTVASATDTLTVNIDMVGTDNYIEVNSADSIAAGDFLAFSDISDSNTVKKITYTNLFAGYMQGFFIDADTNGGAVTATNNYMDIAGGTAISTAWTGVGSNPQIQTVTVNHNNFGTAGTYAYPSAIQTNAQGHVISVTAGSAPGTMSSWTLAGDSGSQSITNGNTATFIGGTGITTAASATDDLTITNSLPFNSITLAASSGSNSTIANSGTITIAAGSNISTTNNGSGTVTIAYTGGTGTMSSFTLAADSGSSQTISNGNTMTIAGSGSGVNAGIDTVASATDTVTVLLDLNELTTATSISKDADFLVGVDGGTSGNEKILYKDVHLNDWGDAEADIDFGGNKLLDVATGTAGTDGVNLAQVQALVAGTGIFQGGYDAINNTPALTGASNVAMDTGDFYAVTDSNNTSFLGTVVEVGDLIFANNTIAANSSPSASDYTIVQSGQSIAEAGATDGATTKGITGFDSANFQVTGNGWTQLKNTGVSAGSYGGATKSLSATVTAKGLLTSLSEQAISIPSSQVQNFCTDVETCVNSAFFYQVTFGNASDTDYAISHGFNTKDVMCQIYDVASGDTIYAEVERTSTSVVTVRSNSAPGTNAWRILVTNVSG